MALPKGMTVEQAIEHLKKLPPGTILANQSDFGAAPVERVLVGYLYQTGKPSSVDTGLAFDIEVSDLPLHKPRQLAVVFE